MNTDVEDLLREALQRLSDDLRAPAGMTERAARRRRRRLALRSAATLTAGAMALMAVVVAGARHHGAGGPTVSTAYVVKRVDSALSAADPGEIAQMAVTTRRTAVPGGATATITSEVWSYRGQWRLVTNWPAGKSEYDVGFSTSSACTVVSYKTRTWARQPGRGRPTALVPHGAGSGSYDSVAGAFPGLFPFGLRGLCSAASPLPATVATALRMAVSRGSLAVAGRLRVDGIEAVELTSRSDSMISESICVSPVTYLPVRVVVRSAPGTPFLRQAADITWLSPTVQNRARLTVPIPAGFRRVPFAQAIGPALEPPDTRAEGK